MGFAGLPLPLRTGKRAFALWNVVKLNHAKRTDLGSFLYDGRKFGLNDSQYSVGRLTFFTRETMQHESSGQVSREYPRCHMQSDLLSEQEVKGGLLHLRNTTS